mgnify:CR=1 FL=1
MKKKTALLFFVLFLLVCGCKKQSPTESSLKANATIAEAKAFWESKRITNYILEQTIQSWYPWDDSVRIIIVADTINSIVSVKTGISLDRDSWGRYKTVRQLFEIAEYDTSVYFINYELDTKYGYPRVLFFAVKPFPRTEGGIKIVTYSFTRK